MIQFRKTKIRNTGRLYSLKPIIRISKLTQAVFIISSIIIEKLGLDVSTEGVMFGVKNKQLIISKEPIADDNYHLHKADANTYRFRSIELYKYVVGFYKVPENKEFIIEMQDDFTFKKI